MISCQNNQLQQEIQNNNNSSNVYEIRTEIVEQTILVTSGADSSKINYSILPTSTDVDIDNVNEVTSEWGTKGISLGTPVYEDSIENLLERNYGVEVLHKKQKQKIDTTVHVKSKALVEIKDTLTTSKKQQASKTYIVKKKDTYFSIAKKFNIEVEKLKKHNKNANLVVGTTLIVPQ